MKKQYFKDSYFTIINRHNALSSINISSILPFRQDTPWKSLFSFSHVTLVAVLHIRFVHGALYTYGYTEDLQLAGITANSTHVPHSCRHSSIYIHIEIKVRRPIKSYTRYLKRCECPKRRRTRIFFQHDHHHRANGGSGNRSDEARRKILSYEN